MSDRELYEEGLIMDLDKMKALLKEFFILLERTEETDDGRVFHPTIVRSSRALDAEKLKTIMAELKRTVTENNKSDG